MTYGIIVNDDSGNIIIDENFRRPALCTTFTGATALSSGAYLSPSSHVQAQAAVNSIAVLRPEAGKWAALYHRMPTATAGYTGASFVRSAQESGPTSYEIKILTTAGSQTIKSGTSHGLIVYDAGSVPVFDSRESYFCVDSVISFTPSGAVTSTDLTLPTPAFGRRFVAFIGTAVGTRTVTPATVTEYDVYFRLNSETSISYGTRISRTYSNIGFSAIPMPSTTINIISGHML